MSRIVIKFCALGFILLMTILFMVFMVQYTAGEHEAGMNLADQMDAYEDYYREKNYSKLRDYLQLFDGYDESFDMYWEAVDGYADYMQYIQWSNTSEDDVEGSQEIARIYKEKVIKNAENCKFSENKKQLEGYVNSINE